MSSRLTASQLDRAKSCLVSFALPTVTFASSMEASRGQKYTVSSRPPSLMSMPSRLILSPRMLSGELHAKALT